MCKGDVGIPPALRSNDILIGADIISSLDRGMPGCFFCMPAQAASFLAVTMAVAFYEMPACAGMTGEVIVIVRRTRK